MTRRGWPDPAGLDPSGRPLQPRADRYTDEQLEAAVASISDFTQPYQASATHPQPLFRRVARPGPQQVES